MRGTVAATAYRVAQECLTNALRHSAAREIVLRIERRAVTENALLICVDDDGGGDAAQRGTVRRLRPDRNAREGGSRRRLAVDRARAPWPQRRCNDPARRLTLLTA